MSVVGRGPHPAGVRGVSLVELMVALVLGLIVAGSALTLVMTNRQTFTATENLGRVQESTRMAFELLARDLRRAGAVPCDGRLTPANGLVNPQANWWSNWGPAVGPAVIGYDGDTAFSDSAFGTGAGQRLAGTDAIELKTASPPPGGSIVTTALGGPGDEIDVSSVTGLETGDLLVVCNFVNASLFQVTGFNGDSIEHVAGVQAWQNKDADLDYLPTTTSADYDKNAVVAILNASRWYVGCNGRIACDAPGGRSLYRASLTNASGSPAVAVDEIVPGVHDMDLEYLTPDFSDYGTAGSVADWDSEASPVVAVRATLVLEGEDRLGPDGEPLQRTLQYTVAFRNRAP